MKKFLFFRRALLSLTVLSVVAAPKNVAAAESIRFREAANGMPLKLLFEQLSEIRSDVRIPLILMLDQAQGDASESVSKLFEALGR